MPRNGSGVYATYTPGNPVVAGTTIDPVAFNNTTTDLATAMTNSVARNGEGVPTANWPMAGFKLTGLANGTIAGDSLAYGQTLPNFPNVTSPVSASNTELSYVAGVTSAIQTQLGTKVTAGAVGSVYSATKLLTTSRSSTTTLTADPDLSVALGAGSYSFQIWMPIWGTTTGSQGFKFSMNFTGTNSSGVFAYSGTVNAAASTASQTIAYAGNFSFSTVVAGTGSTGVDQILVTGTITNITVAGNLQLIWAQNSSNANATNVGINAWMNCVRVG